MTEKYKSKYHREAPIREITPESTLYSAVLKANSENLDSFCSNFGGIRKTFRTMLDEADRLAAAMLQNGIKENDYVGVIMMTTPEVASVLLGINKIGAVSFWIDASLSAEFILKYIKENNIRKIVVSEIFVPLINKLSENVDIDYAVYVRLPGTNTPYMSRVNNCNLFDFTDFINVENYKSLEAVPFSYDRISIVVQSSGSTGTPKLIAHTDFNFNYEMNKMAYVDLPFYYGYRGLVIAPPWIIYGLCNSIYSQLIFGMEAVFTFKPEENLIYTYLGTFDIAFGVPVYYRYLFEKMKNLSKTDSSEYKHIKSLLSDVKVFISGGDKLSEEDTISWEHMFEVPIVNGYGNNETVGAAIVTPQFAIRPGSIGIPMWGTAAKLFDPVTNKLLPDNEQGELCIGSEAVFVEYIGDKASTDSVKQFHNGRYWVHTGDMATIDKDGFVYITGRIKRLIITKMGYKVFPDSVENIIKEVEYVKECVVVGVKVDEGISIAAFVELNYSGTDSNWVLDIIKQYAKNNLKEYECPSFFFLIDKIPYKENGGKRDILCLEKEAETRVKMSSTCKQN